MPSIRSRLLREFPSTRIWIALVVLAGMVNAVLAIALAVVLSTVLARAFESRISLAAATPLLLLVALIARGLMMWTAECAGHAGARRVISELRRRLFHTLAARGPEALNDTRTGALAVASTTGIDALDIYFSGYLPQLALGAVVPCLVLAYLVTTDWLSALIVFVTLPLIPLFMRLVGSAAQHHMDRRWALVQRLSAYFLDVVEGLPDLRIFGRADAQVERIRTVTAASRKATMGTLAIAFLSSMVLEILASIWMALVAAVIGLRLVEGAMTLQTGLAVLIVVPEAYLPLRQLGTFFHSSKEGMTAAATVLEITDSSEESRASPSGESRAGTWEPQAPLPAGAPPGHESVPRPVTTSGSIRFTGVTCLLRRAM